jgi:hypothetical protein
MDDSWLRDVTDLRCLRLLRAGRAAISSCGDGETPREELLTTLGALVVLSGVGPDDLTRAVRALCNSYVEWAREEARRAISN